MRLRALAAAAVAAAAVVPLGAVSASAADTYEVTVVHGISFVDNVDVLVNGTAAISDLAFGEIDSIPAEAGTYDVGVALTGETDPILAADDFVVDKDVTVVAQLDEDAQPTLGVYPDDFSPIAAGNTRVTVRHAAAAPAVDIYVNDGAEPTFAELLNGFQASADIPAGDYSFAVKVDGEAVPGLQVETTTLEAGVSYVVYAVGDEEDGYSIILDAISGLTAQPTPTPSTSSASSASSTPAIPTAVPAGDGSDTWAGPLGLPAAIAIVLGLGVAATIGFSVRRSSASHR